MFDLKLIFILSYLALVSSQNNQTNFCNCRLKVRSKVVGGKVVNDGHVPWFASLAYLDGHLCGSVILNQRYLLTATHCLEDKEESDFTVRVGINRLDATDIANKTFLVERFYRNPKFVNVTLPGDLSIIKLKTKINFLKNLIEPGCFEKTVDLKRNYTAVLTAFGFGSQTPSYEDRSEKKLIVFNNSNFLKLMEFTEVLEDHENHLIKVDPVRVGESICSGDSGSPLSFEEIGGRLTVVGIASHVFGVDDGKKRTYYCKGRAAFSRVAFDRQFIESIVEPSSICRI